MTSRFFPYATDSGERELFAYYFAAISIFLVWLIFWVLERFHVQIPWWIAVPSPVGVYFALRGLFANRLWRWKVWHSLGLIKIPDLNGRYDGFFWTSDDDHSTGHPCQFTISQSWVSILIRGTFAESHSFNMVTGFTVEGTDSPTLTYEYWNTPLSGSAETMAPHRGTIWFDIIQKDTALHLDGEYYTGRGRTTHGRIKVVRVAQ